MTNNSNPFDQIDERFIRLEGIAEMILENQKKEVKQTEEYLTIAEYCKELKVSRPTANKHLNAGKINRYRIDGRVLIKRSEVEQMLNDSTKD